MTGWTDRVERELPLDLLPFVESRVEAQRRVYRLNPGPLQEVDAWLAPFRRFWSKHVDALERHLDKMAKEPAVKGRKRHEQP